MNVYVNCSLFDYLCFFGLIFSLELCCRCSSEFGRGFGTRNKFRIWDNCGSGGAVVLSAVYMFFFLQLVSSPFPHSSGRKSPIYPLPWEDRVNWATSSFRHTSTLYCIQPVSCMSELWTMLLYTFFDCEPILKILKMKSVCNVGDPPRVVFGYTALGSSVLHVVSCVLVFFPRRR